MNALCLSFEMSIFSGPQHWLCHSRAFRLRPEFIPLATNAEAFSSVECYHRLFLNPTACRWQINIFLASVITWPFPLINLPFLYVYLLYWCSCFEFLFSCSMFMLMYNLFLFSCSHCFTNCFP